MTESGDHMKLDLWSEFEKLRGKISHGSKGAGSSTVTKWLNELEIELPEEEIPAFVEAILEVSSDRSGMQIVPSFLLRTIENLLKDDYSNVENICDPFARIGSIILPLWDHIKPTNAFAFTNMKAEAYIGETITKNKNMNWQVGNPLQLIKDLENELDIICCVTPFNVKTNEVIELFTRTGEIVSLKDHLGNLIIASACKKLKSDGIGVFVVPTSFFFSKQSVYQHFDSLGIGVNAVFALPTGTFAPQTSIESYLIVIKKQVSEKMFAAQLGYDLITNAKIVSNYKKGIVGESLELGRIVETTSFKTLNTIRIKEKIEKAQKEFKGESLTLKDVANSINLGRSVDDFAFEDNLNAVYIPLIGNSDVVEAIDDLKLKNQNYAQVIIDSQISNNRFIVHFLNSELGIEIRELSKTGTTIPKLNTKALMELPLLLPDINVQTEILNVQELIIAEKNILLGLQNEIQSIERELWSKPQENQEVKRKIKECSMQNTKADKRAKAQIDLWIDTLPFPLASILRSWHTTSNKDYKTKYEYLLHFFEAMTQFISITFLSAFKESDNLYYEHEGRLKEALKKNNLSLQRTTFGTWKFVADYFAKQTRILLNGSDQDKKICSDIFSDPTLRLPIILSNKDLLKIFEVTNSMRNDWKGHGGVIGQKVAKLRNEKLQLELNKTRKLFADLWEEIYLIMPLNSIPRKGIFENEIAIIMGSNSNFNKDIWKMSTWLDVDSLYLHKYDYTKSLKLIPFIKMGASPESVRNACYFYNRLVDEGARFISYHHEEEAEIISSIDHTAGLENLFKIR